MFLETKPRSPERRCAMNLGPIVERQDIPSSLAPFRVLPDYKVRYPKVIVAALGDLFAEYNAAFEPLVEANREWKTDYRFAVTPDGVPANFAVQVDMVGLTEEFLRNAAKMPQKDVRETLRGMIFEIENSLAMYSLLEGGFAWNSRESFFKARYRAVLEDIRRRTSRPIALLAVTDQKLEAMRASEFGKSEGEALTDAEVHKLSGFDRLFGPAEFRGHLEQRGGCEYLLYVRSSDPVAKLKRPDTAVDHPLLADAAMRRVIKECSVTFNIDDPFWPVGDSRRINDTKWYMPPMGMAYSVVHEEDLWTPTFAAHLAKGKPYAEWESERLSTGFVAFLESFGSCPNEVEEGQRAVRLKPAQGTYGCYGHVSGPLPEGRVRRDLRRGLKDRGPYVAQPELQCPVVINETGKEFVFIDRNFLGLVGDEIRFLGGFRSLMPLDSTEAKNGRNHGSHHTVWAEITD